MRADDSMLDAGEMARARALLARPRAAERVWPALAAAALLAASSIGFAFAMVLAPPLTTTPIARSAP